MTTYVNLFVLLVFVASVLYALERNHARWRREPLRAVLGSDLSRDRDRDRQRFDLDSAASRQPAWGRLRQARPAVRSLPRAA